MKKASTRMDDAARKRIAEAVTRAEAKTSAEIVPVIATDSGRYDRPEDLGGFLAALATLTVVWLVFQGEDPTAGGWGGLPLTLQLPALLGVLVGGFILGTGLTSRVATIRRLLTPRRQLDEEVEGRASQVFFDQRIHHTTRSSGVMIYISLFEHRVRILADQDAYAKLGQQAIDEICSSTSAAIRQEGLTTAICQAIGALGEQLALVLPGDGGDQNDLEDALVVLD